MRETFVIIFPPNFMSQLPAWDALIKAAHAAATRNALVWDGVARSLRAGFSYLYVLTIEHGIIIDSAHNDGWPGLDYAKSNWWIFPNDEDHVVDLRRLDCAANLARLRAALAATGEFPPLPRDTRYGLSPCRKVTRPIEVCPLP